MNHTKLINSILSGLSKSDPEIFDIIQKELNRQENNINLIASENYVSKAVLEAQGSVLTNKYAEGYPGKRYYDGCEYVDIAEQIAISRAKELFGAAYVNVQPHSGSQANAAVYAALIKPRDNILGMSLSAGGHLTHGSKVNFSGKTYNASHYGVNADGVIDYDEVLRIAKECRPKLIMTGFSAYSRILDWQKFRKIADEVGAYLVADIAHVAGLIATGLYPSPIKLADAVTSTTHKTLRGPRGGIIMARSNPEIEKKLDAAIFPGIQGGPCMHTIAAKAVAFKEALSPEFKQYQNQVLLNARTMASIFMDNGYHVVSGGTDNHLFLISLLDKKITGKLAAEAFSAAGIIVNKNSVPNDTHPPTITGGVRIGTPAVTTRGLSSQEVSTVANWMCEILDAIKHAPECNLSNLVAAEFFKKIRLNVHTMCNKFQMYCDNC